MDCKKCMVIYNGFIAFEIVHLSLETYCWEYAIVT